MIDVEKGEQKVNKDKITSNEEKAVAHTQTQLIWRQFKKHKLAITGLVILAIMYFICVIFPGFFAPYKKFQNFDDTYVPPNKIRFIDQEGNFHFRPFVYGYEKEMDMDTWQTEYKTDYSERYPIYFFVKGESYKLWGLFETDIHFFGIEKEQGFYLLGTDRLGRDLFSRTIYGGRISLTIGFVGVFISLILGLFFGGISGLVGGITDDIIQRVIEMLMSIPKIPLWMALAAAIPQEWSAIQVYFTITIILSLMGWTGLARVVRSKFISLREEEFVAAARSYNASMMTIITKHLIPNFLSYLIVNITLAIPGMILGETSLSFLGIGLRPPVVSLGVLLNQAQSFQTVSMYPWLMIPGVFIVLAVLSYNFVGDGLRDAADPYN
ncbi:MAG: ABC transporter permease [Halanaerobiales bacterium]